MEDVVVKGWLVGAGLSKTDSSACEKGEPLQIKATVPAADQRLQVPHYVGRYSKTCILGEGSFGRVVHAWDESVFPPQQVAIKLLPRGSVIRQYKTYVTREILHQSVLKHPLIVGLREVFLTPEYLAIAMEYVEGGDLFQYVSAHSSQTSRLPEREARWIFQQLIMGLDYCHSQGVANRDLKLENILLRHVGEGHPLLKICDFGFSKHDCNSSAQTGVGTPTYMSPEVVMGNNKYDAKKADLWSAGVMLYAILFGRYPFDAKDKNHTKKIMTADYSIPSNVEVSMSCKDLIIRMLVAIPEKRINMNDIKRHPWFLEDLAPGALEMNDMYMQNHSAMEQQAQAVEMIVLQAQRIALPGEESLSLLIS